MNENSNDDKINLFLKKIVESVKDIVDDDKMINKCDMCQGIIGRYLEKLGIEYYPCSTNKVISNNITGHSFIVAKISDDYYVIDPSFIQFKYDYSEEKVINGIKCISKSPYYYLNKIDSDLTNKLIDNGYFKLDKNSAYAYGNAFYFTKTSIPYDFDLIPIHGDIIINAFKKGNDKLTNYNVGEIELDYKESRLNR